MKTTEYLYNDTDSPPYEVHIQSKNTFTYYITSKVLSLNRSDIVSTKKKEKIELEL